VSLAEHAEATAARAGGSVFRMRVRIGTSGFSYKPWKGTFYPHGLKDPDMLRFYAQRFTTVEINNTFYRMPTRDVLARWAEDVPEGFSFVLKAPRRISHIKRLGDVADDLAYLLQTAEALGTHRGPLLVQLPPYMKKDVERLRSFLALLPRGQRAAFEFRHPTWAADDVRDTLRDHEAALCQADTDEEPVTSVVSTAPWGYLRLRRLEYTDAQLDEWVARVRAQRWEEAWVFFKHEDEARGPAFAAALQERLEAI
jgi:uncharacterized protein YecE (DUF72 family)